MTQTAEAVGGGEVEMGAAKDAVGTQWWRQQKCLLWRSSLPLMLNLDGFLGRPGKREVCVYVAGQRKVWCAKRFAPLSPTPRSPEAPCTAAVYGLQQASTVLNSSDVNDQ